jgi:Tfp pilus assembly protein PilX
MRIHGHYRVGWNAQAPAATRGFGAVWRRGGAVLIAVMFCLAVITLLWGVLLRVALMQQRQQQMAEWHTQAQWLAESAIERAAAQLVGSSDYSGETWQVAQSELGVGATGVVLIEVDRSDGSAAARHVRVRADYLRDGERRARVSKQISMIIPSHSTEAAL